MIKFPQIALLQYILWPKHKTCLSWYYHLTKRLPPGYGAHFSFSSKNLQKQHAVIGYAMCEEESLVYGSTSDMKNCKYVLVEQESIDPCIQKARVHTFFFFFFTLNAFLCLGFAFD